MAKIYYTTPLSMAVHKYIVEGFYSWLKMLDRRNFDDEIQTASSNFSCQYSANWNTVNSGY